MRGAEDDANDAPAGRVGWRPTPTYSSRLRSRMIDDGVLVPASAGDHVGFDLACLPMDQAGRNAAARDIAASILNPKHLPNFQPNRRTRIGG